MKINREIVESYLGKKVTIKLFDGSVVIGYLHKTGEDNYKKNPNLYIPKKYYFVERDDIFGNKQSSCLFRSSHIRRIYEVN